MIVDWQVYYDAAGKCHKLAEDLTLAFGPLHRTLVHDCEKMAGDAPGCKEWGQAYDQRAQEFVQATATLANALTRYGDVLAALGYNHGLANKSNPPPTRPAESEPLYDSGMALPATSVGDNGIGIDHGGGIDELFARLFAKVIEEFGKLPNGNVDQLRQAADAWKTFAEHDAITKAASRIAEVSDLFHEIEEDNLQTVLDQIATLHSGAENLANAATAMATPVSEYHTSHVVIRDKFASAITTAEWAVGLTVAAAVVATLFSGPVGAGAGTGGVTAIVANLINTLRTTYQISRLYEILGLTAAVAGAIGLVKAFDKVPDLGTVINSLAGIIAMRVLIDDDSDADTSDSGSTAGSGAGPVSAREVSETVESRTQPGKTPPHRQANSDPEVRQLYEDLTRNGEPIDVGKYPGQGSRLPDGTEIRIRDDSSSGGVTIDIKYPTGTDPKIVKVHLP